MKISAVISDVYSQGQSHWKQSVNCFPVCFSAVSVFILKFKNIKMINVINIPNRGNVGLDNCDMKSSDRLTPSCCDKLVSFSTDDDRLNGGSSVRLCLDRALESHLGG